MDSARYSGCMAAVAQNRIALTLSDEKSVVRVRGVVESGGCSTRQAVAEQVCAQFGFRDWRGRLQVSTCLTALTRLERAGRIELPASGERRGWKRVPRGTGHAPPAVMGVPEHAGRVSGLELKLVVNEPDRRLWNELLLREHPQGDRIITGRQLRYLIWSDHGLLGALGVSSSALHLEDRDRWIGWDWETRRKYLERVVCLSRFLIRPSVHCRNLASKVLGVFAGRVEADFERHYGYRPWLLESFVDTERHPGSCFRAANWTLVGRSKGRGRYDSEARFAESPKDIYVYCLETDFRLHMGLPPDSGAVALAPADGLEDDGWADKEFAEASLGDRRLSRRLVSIAAVKARNPTKPFSECADGELAYMQGYHRFLEHPDRDAVSMEAILAPHRQRTVKRMRSEKRVLCVQDTTTLDYSSLAGCVGLGPTGANGSGVRGRGLRLHSTLALTANGLPLGILNSECVARKFYGKGNKEKRRRLPFEQKEGYRWLAGIKACEETADELPQARLVCVMDREADIFELFSHNRDARKVHLLVRVARDRRSDSAGTMFEEIGRLPVHELVRINLPKRRNSKRRLVEPYADLQIRYKPITLPVPKHKKRAGLTPVPLWLVHATEPNPPPSTTPIDWYLFSTEQIDSVDRALQALREYSRRWRIEEWHKVLKSGCKVEDIIAEDAEAIRRLVAINMVIAWRVMLMVLLGREQPDLPPDILFSNIELQVLTRFAQTSRYRTPDTLADAVWLTAKLGGYLGRKSDPPPGAIVMWRGCVKLEAMARGAALFLPPDPG